MSTMVIQLRPGYTLQVNKIHNFKCSYIEIRYCAKNHLKSAGGQHQVIWIDEGLFPELIEGLIKIQKQLSPPVVDVD